MIKPKISIGDREYTINPDVDRYQVALNDLGDLRMSEIPPHSHLEIMGLQPLEGSFETEVYGLNAGDAGEIEYLEIYGGTSIRVTSDDLPRMMRRLRHAFPDRGERGFLPNPNISAHEEDDGTFIANVHLNLKFKDAPETLVRDGIIPFVEGFARLNRPTVHVFICHASEDKPAAREIASAMKNLGADVWFDEWEIRVGDSIVQRINDALGEISHLIVLLSKESVSKPWVKKELSAALMRQLSSESIVVLPARLDDCAIPPILADIKYADVRAGVENAMKEIEWSLFSSTERNEIS